MAGTARGNSGARRLELQDEVRRVVEGQLKGPDPHRLGKREPKRLRHDVLGRQKQPREVEHRVKDVNCP